MCEYFVSRPLFWKCTRRGTGVLRITKMMSVECGVHSKCADGLGNIEPGSTHVVRECMHVACQTASSSNPMQ